jgi:hypothetical protein
MANRVTGKVDRIYARTGGVNIRLADLPASSRPKDGYFLIKQTHENYEALYSLAYTAAVNRYDLQVRTVGEISSAAQATVSYLVVDW